MKRETQVNCPRVLWSQLAEYMATEGRRIKAYMVRLICFWKLSFLGVMPQPPLLTLVMTAKALLITAAHWWPVGTT